MLNACVLQSSTRSRCYPAKGKLAPKKRLIALVSDSVDDDDEQTTGQGPEFNTCRNYSTKTIHPRQTSAVPARLHEGEGKPQSAFASASAPVKRQIISSDQAKEPLPPKKIAVDGGSKPTPQVSLEGQTALVEGEEEDW
jgi:hypothetical protein